MVSAQTALSAAQLALISDDLRAVFLCEVTELSHRLDDTLALAALDLTAESIGDIGRLLHTMKGAAAAAGELEVRDVMHALEDRAQALSVADRVAADEILIALTTDLARLQQKLERTDSATGSRPRQRRPEVLLDALQRAAGDAARDCDKAVRLIVHPDAVTSGTPLIIRLYEPLLHLVRNAVAHGIETAKERSARGKDPIGTIAIDSNCDDGSGTIWVIDDGGGIDLDAVRRRAAELGVDIPDGEAFCTEILLEVLCRPGFSTRDQPDAAAGRGLGLFAVRSALCEQGGTLSLYSVPGTGCIFTLQVPLVK